PRGLAPPPRPQLAPAAQMRGRGGHVPPPALLPGSGPRALRALRRAVRRARRPLPELSGRRPESVHPAEPDPPAVLLRRPVRLPDRGLALQRHHGPAVGSPV